MSNILFSPLGLTDPISNFRDGAMLHICRNFPIDKVYLYISKEVYEYHQYDNRYLYCLDRLSDLLNRRIDHELIIRDTLEDVHVFDYFIDEFRAIITDIHEKEPQAQLYLNVSSGTPAMKSALQILAAFREFDMIPVQVGTPERRSNPHAEEKLKYNPEEQWECNEDNSVTENRCTISSNVSFLLQIKKQMLAELIKKYDYAGANALAATMKNSLDPTALELIDGAEKRIGLDYNGAKTDFSRHGIKVLETEQSNFAPVTEYLLALDIKVRRMEFADFLRGLTPLLADLFELVLLKLGISVNSFTNKTKDGVRKWSEGKLKQRTDILNALNNEYNGGFRFGELNSDSMLAIISHLSNDEQLINKCSVLRKAEKTTRNLAAHEIVTVDDEWIKACTNLSAAELIKSLRALIDYTDIRVGRDFFSSYDKMNEYIIDFLKK